MVTDARIKKLQKQSVDIVPFIDPERAVLITDFYQSEFSEGLSEPVLRALAHVNKIIRYVFNVGA